MHKPTHPTHYIATLQLHSTPLASVLEDATLHLYLPAGESFTLRHIDTYTNVATFDFHANLTECTAEEWVSDLAESCAIELLSVVPSA
jgi:hypothetical protein